MEYDNNSEKLRNKVERKGESLDMGKKLIYQIEE